MPRDLRGLNLYFEVTERGTNYFPAYGRSRSIDKITSVECVVWMYHVAVVAQGIGEVVSGSMDPLIVFGDRDEVI
jgi:hypothetical protein